MVAAREFFKKGVPYKKKGTFLHKENTVLIERHVLFQKEHICTLFKKNILNWIV